MSSAVSLLHEVAPKKAVQGSNSPTCQPGAVRLALAGNIRQVSIEIQTHRLGGADPHRELGNHHLDSTIHEFLKF